MISKSMQKALGEQINKEFYSAYIYLGLSAGAAAAGLPGISTWFRAQYEEEQAHALKIFDYLIDRNAAVALAPIAKPAAAFNAPLAVFESVLKHEQAVTRSINDLMDQAVREKDHATHNLLEWFVSEQVEEEAQVQVIIDRLHLIGREGSGLFLLDLELGRRGAAPAAAAAPST